MQHVCAENYDSELILFFFCESITANGRKQVKSMGDQFAKAMNF